MLRLITGKAGTGKTAAVIEEIHQAVLAGKGKRLMIVPEQYSHEAERELCRVCGDRLSLFAEVFSFSALARRVSSECGMSAQYLDKGGRLLCMALALRSIGSKLKIYGTAEHKAELQALLLTAVDEMKTACVGADALLAAAESCPGSLGDKLSDLALIYEAYCAVVSNGHADPTDRLTVLAEQIPESFIDAETHIYIDGFTDFTAQEREVLCAMMRRGAELTVCLTVDALDGGSEIFELSRRAAKGLLADARAAGIRVSEEHFEEDERSRGLEYFADNVFSSTEAECADDGSIRLFCADSLLDECELAAAEAIRLTRAGCRRRDIAIAVRGFDDYRTALESVFSSYGVPLFTARKTDMLSKPIPALIGGAYDIINGGWDVDDMVSYMRTGLTGLSAEQCDTLENYIFKWQLRAGAWESERPWHQHPEGYGKEYDGKTDELLSEIDTLRRTLSAPLLALKKRSGEAMSAAGQARALTAFFEDIELPQRLEERAEELSAAGRETLAREYAQIWDTVVSALEQCDAILGDMPLDADSFGQLFTLMLSKYDIGTIPVALDRVSAGEFDRMRRRSIKHLIILGASDDRLPRNAEQGGVFSDEERRRLLEMDIDLGGIGDGELWREYSLIYNCLTLPSESLTMCFSTENSEGGRLRPAAIFTRAETMFSIAPQHADMTAARLEAPDPALSAAAHAFRGGSRQERAAAEYFRSEHPERYRALQAASEMTRGRLSGAAVEKLYGTDLKLSASKTDKFASCKYAYFCQYGLNAKPYEPAGFTPPEIGSFMHAILENTAREVHDRGGFAAVSDRELDKIADKYIEEYISRELNDFREKSSRFIYLFKRISHDVHQVLNDMAAELRRSDFEPISFEFNFGRAQDIPPVRVGDGETALTLTGIADRVDGWEHDGKLYLRIADYKTGKKAFSLSDVWYGMGIQMLLYLFTLSEEGRAHFGGRELMPAGVMYVPARNDITSLTKNVDDDTAEDERLKKLRRSGIVLDAPEVIEAWEHGEDTKYIPVKIVRGKRSEESLVSLERMGVLSRHIKKRLGEMAAELRRGCISADPYYRSQQETACTNCRFFDACHFAPGENGEEYRLQPKLKNDAVWEKMSGGEENG